MTIRLIMSASAALMLATGCSSPNQAGSGVFGCPALVVADAQLVNPANGSTGVSPSLGQITSNGIPLGPAFLTSPGNVPIALTFTKTATGAAASIPQLQVATTYTIVDDTPNNPPCSPTRRNTVGSFST